MESWDIVEADQEGLFLINILQYITFQKYGINQLMLEVLEADRSLHLCFHRATMNRYAYTTEFKARVQVYDALVLRVGCTEAAAKDVAEEDGINMSNPSNANKWKSYFDKDEVHFQEAMHFTGLNNIIYKGLMAEVRIFGQFRG